MRALDLIGGTEIMTESDCWELLATQQVGRIGFVCDGRVEILPVNYSVHNDTIVFRTNPGRKMAALTGSSDEVAFEVDLFDSNARCGCSVVVHGRAIAVPDHDSLSATQAAQPWPGDKEFVIQITCSSLTGRRVSAQRSP